MAAGHHCDPGQRALLRSLRATCIYAPEFSSHSEGVRIAAGE